jgi:hypothetical protein
MVIPICGYRNCNRSVLIVRVLKISDAKSPISTKSPVSIVQVPFILYILCCIKNTKCLNAWFKLYKFPYLLKKNKVVLINRYV